jgi:hypothetical protein
MTRSRRRRTTATVSVFLTLGTALVLDRTIWYVIAPASLRRGHAESSGVRDIVMSSR